MAPRRSAPRRTQEERSAATRERLLEAAIDLLWRFFSGPTYYAWLELVLAARTEPALRDRLHGLLERFNADAQQVYEEVFPPAPGRSPSRTAPLFAFAVLKGLAIDRIVSGDDEGVARVLRALKGLAAGLGPRG